MNPVAKQEGSLRALARLGLVLGTGILAGALVAPHAFNGLLFLGRRFAWAEGLRAVEFEKVAGRCVLLASLAVMVPALRAVGLLSANGLGLSGKGRWMRELGVGWIAGVASLLALVLAGLACGAYRLVPEATGLGALAGTVLAAFAGSLVVGFIEEPLFRGAIYGMLRRGFSPLPAALLASVIFSSVHFAYPDLPTGVVYGRWDSGLRALPHLFTAIDVRWDFSLMWATLFFMGMTLCALYDITGDLYAAIGLHAGWVWVLALSEFLLERDLERFLPLFGPGMTVPKSLLAVAVVAGSYVGVSAWRIARSRRES